MGFLRWVYRAMVEGFDFGCVMLSFLASTSPPCSAATSTQQGGIDKILGAQDHPVLPGCLGSSLFAWRLGATIFQFFAILWDPITCPCLCHCQRLSPRFSTFASNAECNAGLSNRVPRRNLLSCFLGIFAGSCLLLVGWMQSSPRQQ